MNSFYRTFDEVSSERFDGLVITGAPVENYDFQDVQYWDELVRLMDWADSNVFSTLYICWAAQARCIIFTMWRSIRSKKTLRHLPARGARRSHKLVRGFDEQFMAPHSRHTTIYVSDAAKIRDLDIIATSQEAGVYLAASHDGRRVFVTGHSEYDAKTLELEYRRDLAAGKPIQIPKNYYPNDDDTLQPVITWRAHGALLFANWLNYFVYQETPYDVSAITGRHE